MMERKVSFDFKPNGSSYYLTMQEVGGENTISVTSFFSMDYIESSNAPIGRSEKFYVKIDALNNDCRFKDYFGLASHYQFRTKASLDAFIEKLPKPIREALKKQEVA